MKRNKMDAAVATAVNKAFTSTPSAGAKRDNFVLSHQKNGTIELGLAYPTLHMELIPGDTVSVGQQTLLQLQSLLAPIVTPIIAKTALMFVPNRHLWPKTDESGDDWETFITGGEDGENAAVPPRWNASSGKHSVGSLWDWLGYPCWTDANNFSTKYPDAIVPLDFRKRAYNKGWNDWMRDETLQDEVDIETNEDLLPVAWAADYFTKALLDQQRGIAPAFPVSGTTSAEWANTQFVNTAPASPNTPTYENANATTPSMRFSGGANAATNALAQFNANTVDLSAATTFTVSDLRVGILTQQLFEILARGGYRYTEFLQSLYGVYPEDARLQRAELIGMIETPVIVSQVLQTSASDTEPTPLAQKAGQGMAADRSFIGTYTAKKHGYLIAYSWVMPTPAYSQGINRQDLKTSRLEWFNPLFVGASEQQVYNQELYLGTDGQNQTGFGYEAFYNDYRYERSTTHGLLQTTMSYWTLTRLFGSRPGLNEDFITMTAAERTDLKRVTSVTNQPFIVASYGNIVRALRPMPAIAVPGVANV